MLTRCHASVRGRLCRNYPTWRTKYDDNDLHRYCTRHMRDVKARHPNLIFERI